MNTQQLLEHLQSDPATRLIVLGVFPRNKLPRVVCHPSGLICNTDPASRPGEHWICLFIDHNGVGEYFDSFGLPPLHRVFVKYLNKHCVSWTHNSQTLQDMNAETCGLYCLYYLKMRCRGVTRERLLRIFSHDYAANDRLIKLLQGK